MNSIHQAASKLMARHCTGLAASASGCGAVQSLDSSHRLAWIDQSQSAQNIYTRPTSAPNNQLSGSGNQLSRSAYCLAGPSLAPFQAYAGQGSSFAFAPASCSDCKCACGRCQESGQRTSVPMRPSPEACFSIDLLTGPSLTNVQAAAVQCRLQYSQLPVQSASQQQSRNSTVSMPSRSSSASTPLGMPSGPSMTPMQGLQSRRDVFAALPANVRQATGSHAPKLEMKSRLPATSFTSTIEKACTLEVMRSSRALFCFVLVIGSFYWATAEYGSKESFDSTSTGEPAAAETVAVASGETTVVDCEVYVKDSNEYKACIGQPGGDPSVDTAITEGEWGTAYICQEDVYDNSTFDESGRLWGYEDDNSCLFVDAEGKPIYDSNYQSTDEDGGN
eukprot:gene32228-16790_t